MNGAGDKALRNGDGVTMELRQGKIRGTYVIEHMALPLQTEKRLEALGMTKGTPISVLNKKSRGTMIVQVRGTRFALGHGITKNIQVSEAKGERKGEADE